MLRSMWCSRHNSTTHNESDCRVAKAERAKEEKAREAKAQELQSLAANLALLQQARHSNIGSAHLAQSAAVSSA